jgi:hypothetical protein
VNLGLISIEEAKLEKQLEEKNDEERLEKEKILEKKEKEIGREKKNIRDKESLHFCGTRVFNESLMHVILKRSNYCNH